jgi:hypothetical protein
MTLAMPAGADPITLEVHGTDWQCTSPADCASLAQSLGCRLVPVAENTAAIVCDPRGLARHSA